MPNFISCVEANKLINKGCMIWITIINVEEVKEEKSANEVLVIKEYLNVFPNDLSRLPLDREIEFTINLIHSTKLISIPLIRWHQ